MQNKFVKENWNITNKTSVLGNGRGNSANMFFKK